MSARLSPCVTPGAECIPTIPQNPQCPEPECTFSLLKKHETYKQAESEGPGQLPVERLPIGRVAGVLGDHHRRPRLEVPRVGGPTGGPSKPNGSGSRVIVPNLATRLGLERRNHLARCTIKNGCTPGSFESTWAPFQKARFWGRTRRSNGCGARGATSRGGSRRRRTVGPCRRSRGSARAPPAPPWGRGAAAGGGCRWVPLGPTAVSWPHGQLTRTERNMSGRKITVGAAALCLHYPQSEIVGGVAYPQLRDTGFPIPMKLAAPLVRKTPHPTACVGKEEGALEQQGGGVPGGSRQPVGRPPGGAVVDGEVEGGAEDGGLQHRRGEHNLVGRRVGGRPGGLWQWSPTRMGENSA